MLKFIPLTDADGKPLLVNPQHIAIMKQSGKKEYSATVVMSDGTECGVRESMAEIQRQISLAQLGAQD